MFKAIETKTVAANELKPAGKFVKFNRGSIDETVIAAMRLSIKSGMTGYVIPTYYGFTISWKESDTKVVRKYIKVEANTATIFEKAI